MRVAKKRSIMYGEVSTRMKCEGRHTMAKLTVEGGIVTQEVGACTLLESVVPSYKRREARYLSASKKTTRKEYQLLGS